MLSCLRTVIVLFLLSLVVGQRISTASNLGENRALPCPDEEDILPCICTAHGVLMDLDCSHLESEEQLQRVFMALFPYPDFRKFIMNHNPYITTWETGVFGEVSFTEFEVKGNALQNVSYNVFDKSRETVVSMVFQSNDLSVFPFEELPLFSSLEVLDLRRNSFTSFPALASPSLLYLNLGGNLITEVVQGAFAYLVEIKEIELYENQIKRIIPGTYVGHHNLNHVNLQGNNLTFIPVAAIQLTSKTPGTVHLGNNSISDIEANAITNIGAGNFHIEFNMIQNMTESVFGYIFEEGGNISISGNPLICGCELAWVFNKGYLPQVDDKASCYDGELLTDLNPTIFDVCQENRTHY